MFENLALTPQLIKELDDQRVRTHASHHVIIFSFGQGRILYHPGNQRPVPQADGICASEQGRVK